MSWFSKFKKVARNFKAERAGVEAWHQDHVKGRVRRLRASTDDVFRRAMINPQLLRGKALREMLVSRPDFAESISDAIDNHIKENSKHDNLYKSKIDELDQAEAQVKEKMRVRNQRYYENPEFQEQARSNSAERYEANPEAQQQAMAERYKTDPKVRIKTNDASWERSRVKWYGLGDCQCGCAGDSKKHMKIWSKAYDDEYDGILKESITNPPCGCGCKGDIKKHLSTLANDEFPQDPREETESMGRIGLSDCKCGCGGNLVDHMANWRESTRKKNRTPRETLSEGMPTTLASFKRVKAYRTLEAAQGSFWFYNRSTNNNTNYYREQEKLEWFEPYL